MNYKSKSVLIYDDGFYIPFAQRLAKDFGKVMYFTDWENKTPQFKSTLFGKNVPGIERVDKFFDHLDEADLICFPDCTHGDLQLHLESCGYNIWGSRNGSELEHDRVASKKLLEKFNFPVNKYEVIKGTDKLRKYLKSNDNVHVKIDIFRGDMESWKSNNYRFSETRLSELESIFGYAKNKVEFIVEEDLPDRVEIGYDGYCIDGEFPDNTLVGLEIKDLCYVGKFTHYDILPKQVTDVNEMLSPILKKYNYRNFYSTEVRIGKDKKGYPIDLTFRLPLPPGCIYTYMYDNFSEIVYEGAQGKLVQPKVKEKFGVEVLICSEFAKDNWLPVEFSSKYKDNIKLRNVTYIDDTYCTITKNIKCDDIGSIVATGKTIEDCMDQISEIGEDIKAFHLDIPKVSLDKANEEIDKLKKMGYDLFK